MRDNVILKAGLVMSIASLIVLAGFLYLNQEPLAPTAKPRYVWKERATFSGEGAAQTKPFTIRDAPWRLSWKVEGSGPATSVGLTIVPAAPNLPPVFERSGIAAHSRGSTEINDSGVYTVIVSASDGKWKLVAEVYELTAKQPEQPPEPLTFLERLLGMFGLPTKLDLK